MTVPVTNLWDDTISYEEKITWISHNQHVCLNPFQTYYYQVDFNGQQDPKQQRATLRNNCCCNILPTAEIETVKHNILKGVRSKECVNCWNAESQTGSSERTMSLLNVDSKILNHFIKTGQADSYHYRIKFSNLCNLACRTCSPTFSSKYAQTYQLTVPDALYQDIGSDPTTWARITDSITESCRTHDSVSITLLGGESLIQPGAVKLIDWLIDQQLSVSLNITTNLTNLNTQLIKRLQYFNQVSIFASIDSVCNNYEYIRWPAKFDTITGNVKRISQLNNTSLTIQPVWSLNNIFYIIDFLDWWYLWFTENYEVPIRNVVMHRPYYMTIQNLPIRYRPQLITVLGTALDHPIFKSALQESLYHYVSGIKNFLESGRLVHDQFDLFLHETARQDCATNSNFNIGNLRLYSILTETDQQLYHQHPRLDLLPNDQRIVYTQHSPL